jgi:PilZ domain
VGKKFSHLACQNAAHLNRISYLLAGPANALGAGMIVEGPVAERSQRAIDIMRSMIDEARKVSRVHLTVPASISCPSIGCQDKLAIMRDLSTSGAFFYAEIDALEGSKVSLQFVLAAFGKNIQMVCDGIIVRVERFPRGAATGIAVEFDHCNMLPADVS